MAITIKELLAADTISQAADKINFNFDQLLLNGGGPVGPPGPLGPPGPIGGRGIRGTQWFEGSGDPNLIIFPDLEPNDTFLEGPITTGQSGDGDVWEYNGTTWVFTGINLKGDQGTPGASDDWGSWGNPPATSGDGDTLYPVQAGTGGTKPAANDIRSVTLGGIDEFITVLPDTDYNIDDDLARLFNSNDAILYLHTPNQNVSLVKFLGGGPGSVDYNVSNITTLAQINLLQDDILQILDPKASGLTSPYGLNIKTENRGIWLEAGVSFLLQTGLAGTFPGPSNIELTITDDPTPGPGMQGEIILQKTGGDNTAQFKVGTNDSLQAGGYTGNIFGDSKDIYLYASDEMKLYNSAGGGSSYQLTGGNAISTAINIVNSTAGSLVSSNAPFIYLTATDTVDITSENFQWNINNNLNGVVQETISILSINDTINLYALNNTNGHINLMSPKVAINPPIAGVVHSTLTVGNRNGTITSGGDANVAIGSIAASSPGNIPNSLWVEGSIVAGSPYFPPSNNTNIIALGTADTLANFLGINFTSTQGVVTGAEMLIRCGANDNSIGYNALMNQPALSLIQEEQTAFRAYLQGNAREIYAIRGEWGGTATSTPQKNYGIYMGSENQGQLTSNVHCSRNYLENNRGGLQLYDMSPNDPTLGGATGVQDGFSSQNNTATLHIKHGQQLETSNSPNATSGWSSGANEWTTAIHIDGATKAVGGQNRRGLSMTLDWTGPNPVPTPAWKAFGHRIQSSIDQYWHEWQQFGGYVNGINNTGGIAWGTGPGIGSIDKYAIGASMILSPSGVLCIGTTETTSRKFAFGGTTSGWACSGTSWVSPGPADGTALKLNVGGRIQGLCILVTSDKRLKKNIETLPPSLNDIKKLRPVSYEWPDEPGGRWGGFVAQEVAEILPDIVSVAEDDELEGGKLSLHYDSFIAVLTKGMQEQQVMIEDLETENDELKERLKAIEEKLGL